MHQIKAEFQKLFTIRSTYVILAFCLLITTFFAFYIEGFRTVGNVTDAGKLAGEVRSALNALAALIGLIGVLLVTHEYRYNTIMYTLTSTNNRLKVLFAKFVVISIFAIVASLFFGVLSPLLTALALHIKGLSMVAQNIPVLDLLWRGVFFGWGYSVFAFIIATIIRSQVGSIITLLFFPGTIEQLVGLLLKNNASYLPFTALGNVLGSMDRMPTVAAFSPAKSAAITSVYLVIGLLVAAYLFRRRDAN